MLDKLLKIVSVAALTIQAVASIKSLKNKASIHGSP